jgi:hypothetical protein
MRRIDQHIDRQSNRYFNMHIHTDKIHWYPQSKNKKNTTNIASNYDGNTSGTSSFNRQTHTKRHLFHRQTITKAYTYTILGRDDPAHIGEIPIDEPIPF